MPLIYGQCIRPFSVVYMERAGIYTRRGSGPNETSHAILIVLFAGILLGMLWRVMAGITSVLTGMVHCLWNTQINQSFPLPYMHKYYSWIGLFCYTKRGMTARYAGNEYPVDGRETGSSISSWTTLGLRATLLERHIHRPDHLSDSCFVSQPKLYGMLRIIIWSVLEYQLYLFFLWIYISERRRWSQNFRGSGDKASTEIE